MPVTPINTPAVTSNQASAAALRISIQKNSPPQSSGPTSSPPSTIPAPAPNFETGWLTLEASCFMASYLPKSTKWLSNPGTRKVGPNPVTSSDSVQETEVCQQPLFDVLGKPHAKIAFFSDYNPLELASHDQQGYFSSASSITSAAVAALASIFASTVLMVAFWA